MGRQINTIEFIIYENMYIKKTYRFHGGWLLVFVGTRLKKLVVLTVEAD